jgi:uncharacterized membrane protein
MSTGHVVEFVALFCLGLLAGEELVIRYGVRGPVAKLDNRSHIVLRQGMSRSLRVMVPAIYLSALLSTITVTIIDGTSAGLVFHLAAELALIAWIAVTLGGTVPINEAALTWEPAAPPPDWRAQVDRWERLNSVRAWLALGAFALLLIATALHTHAK